MGTQRVHADERGPPWLVRWTCRAGTVVFFCLVYSSQPSASIIFLAAYFFTSLVQIARQPGQAGVLGRLSLCLCL
jgi:hypothetical protein